MPTYQLEDATVEIIHKLQEITELSQAAIVHEALARWHRELLRGSERRSARELVTRLAEGPVTADDLGSLRALRPNAFALAEIEDEARDFGEVDLLFHFVSRSWHAVYHEDRELQEEQDREVLAILLEKGLTPDHSYAYADDEEWSEETHEGGLVLRSPCTALTRLDDLAAYCEEPAIARQRAWLAKEIGSTSDGTLEQLDRANVSFRGQTALTVVVGRRLDGITPSVWLALSAKLERRDDLVLVAGDDLARWTGRPISAVVGLPIVVAFADEGLPEEIRISRLKEALAALPDLDLAALHAGEGDEGVHVLAIGPLASGFAVHGTSGMQGDARAGTFYLGSSMEQIPHRYGAWGESLAYVSHENTTIARLDLEDRVGSLWLVPSFDEG